MNIVDRIPSNLRHSSQQQKDRPNFGFILPVTNKDHRLSILFVKTTKRTSQSNQEMSLCSNFLVGANCFVVAIKNAVHYGAMEW